MGAISEYIRNLAIFLIFASFINIINPGKKFEHYINLVLGIILIFVLIAPISGIINNLAGSSGDIFADISLAYDRAALARQIDQADAAGQEQILALYRDGLVDQARRLVENHGEFYMDTAHFTINSAANSFGEILQIHLILREQDRAQAFVRIDPVRIDPVIGSRGEPPTTTAEPENPHKISLKNLLAGFYNLPADNIIIEVRP